jgi:hypothetical protein
MNEAGSRRGALALDKKGRLGIITGTKHTPQTGTTWFGVSVRTLGNWWSRDPRFLCAIDEHMVKSRMNLERWDNPALAIGDEEE